LGGQSSGCITLSPKKPTKFNQTPVGKKADGNCLHIYIEKINTTANINLTGDVHMSPFFNGSMLILKLLHTAKPSIMKSISFANWNLNTSRETELFS
jgi:hypothetical protein